MSLTLTLDSRCEQLVAAHLRSGRYRSAEEVVARALEALAETEPPAEPARAMTPAEAVADIRELRRGVTLGGLRIRDLIEEGRKYRWPASSRASYGRRIAAERVSSSDVWRRVRQPLRFEEEGTPAATGDLTIRTHFSPGRGLRGVLQLEANRRIGEGLV